MNKKIKKHYVKIALKLIGKKRLEVMAQLSEEEFIKKVQSNPKAKHFSEDVVKMMYKQIIKKYKKQK